MGASVPADSAARHPVLPDIGRPVMAKVNVRTPDIDWAVEIGAAIQRAVKKSGLSNKEAAAAAHVDDAEFGKWLSGSRRPQFDRLFAVEALQQSIVIELAGLAKDIEIVTEIRVRKSA
jgi:hypothetical protein